MEQFFNIARIEPQTKQKENEPCGGCGRERRTNHTIRRDPIEREHSSRVFGSEVHRGASRQPASERGPVAFPEAGAASRRCDRRELMTTQSAQRWTGAVLALLIVPGAAEARAQYPGGNMDNDGALVPKLGRSRRLGSRLQLRPGVVVIPLRRLPESADGAPAQLEYSSGSGDEGLGLGWAIDLGVPDSVDGAPFRRTEAHGSRRLLVRRSRPGVRGRCCGPAPLQDPHRLVPAHRGSVTAPDDYGWVVFEKDGRRLEYGTTGNARSMNPAAGVPSPGIYVAPQPSGGHLGNAVEFTYRAPRSYGD